MPLFPTPRAAQPNSIPEPGATGTGLLRRYRPLRTRATGGFGSVEICLDTRLQRRVAIKRIPLASQGVRTASDNVAAALMEARTASMLPHPNIVSVIDFTYDSAYAYLVMEYVDGMSLEEFLAQVDGHSLTYDEAANVADALVQALSYAHENRVLHLDIKPANVLIDRNGNVKLADFGMATLATAAGFGGARGGTIGYMSPEQLRGDAVDERTDIFALASVLFEALCGYAPFRAQTPAESEELIDQGVTRPSELLPDIPPASEEALMSALSPAPQMRMDSVEEFGDRFCRGLGHARDGRRSFATLIARLTSDEQDPDAESDERPERTWELDPKEGYLGSQTAHARRIAAGAVAGASVAVVSWSLLGTVGLVETLPRLASAAAIGVAAGIAPQLGSALVFAGFVAAVLAGTPLVPALPVVAIACALACGWWLVWGRENPGPSAALVCGGALVCATGDPLLACPIAIAACGCMASGAAAASSAALGMVLGALVAALGQAGALDIAQAASACANPLLIASTALAAAGSAIMAALMGRAWSRYDEDGRNAGYIAAYAVPAAVSILLLCLANRMEIGGATALGAATLVGGGVLSTIIACIYVYLFGYRKEPTGV